MAKICVATLIHLPFCRYWFNLMLYLFTILLLLWQELVSADYFSPVSGNVVRYSILQPSCFVTYINHLPLSYSC